MASPSIVSPSIVSIELARRASGISRATVYRKLGQHPPAK
jgi:transcriptional regulator of acetoin/glycerol metabolism